MTDQLARHELDQIVESEVRKYLTDNSDAAVGVARFSDCATVVQRLINTRQRRSLVERALGPAALRTWEQEPHFRYNLLADIPIPTVQVAVEDGDKFMRLALDAPTQPYTYTPPTVGCLYSDVHIGQRKLLVSEILFMTLHGAKARTVVYIGAAGGQHIPALCEMYPEHRFLLYDPAPFSRPLMDYMRKNPTRVAVYNELFPPADKNGRAARDLAQATGASGIGTSTATAAQRGFLLISDIRRREENADAPTNSDVDADMELQVMICREMQPLAAHLKCRLPYFNPEADPPEPDIQVTLPKGVIYFQPWCGHKSTETRLILEPPYDDPSSTMTLSARWYESALYNHNINTRYTRHITPAIETTDLFLGTVYDTCFDCTFERYTLWRYLVTAVPTTLSTEENSYTNFAALYNLLKRIVGREDERLLREHVPARH